jgi:hypothetical protein
METLVQKLRARTGLLTIAEVAKLLSFHPGTLRDPAPSHADHSRVLETAD